VCFGVDRGFFVCYDVFTKFIEGMKMERCKYCDGCGSTKTYQNQCPIPIDGKVRMIDKCIAQIVASLNANGIKTVASCCGHKTRDGRIDLEDGRVLVIKKTIDGRIVDLDFGDEIYCKENLDNLQSIFDSLVCDLKEIKNHKDRYKWEDKYQIPLLSLQSVIKKFKEVLR
jgi:hypothetical protein